VVCGLQMSVVSKPQSHQLPYIRSVVSYLFVMFSVRYVVDYYENCYNCDMSSFVCVFQRYILAVTLLILI